MPVRTFDDEELQAVRAVLESGNLSSMGGPATPAFEAAFAEALGARRGVAMNSAMSVLHSAVMAAAAGAGDEVICDPVCVFGAVAVMYNNAVPVFVDVNRVTWNMDPDLIEARITERTKAMIVTHVCGLPAEMDRIMAVARRHGLIVIEDCAHSLFATYQGKNTGTWGHIGSFSFQMSKQMALGDGGMAVTDDEALAKALGLHASAPTFHSVAFGLHFNYRMNEQTAAIGLVQLKRARGYIDGLVENAGLYDAAVEGCDWIEIQRGPDEAQHTFHLWGATFRGDEKGMALDDFKRVLAEEEAPLSVGYTNMPAYKHPLIAERLGYGRGCPLDCPLYVGRGNQYPDGLCPNAEWLLPRIILGYPFGARDDHERGAEKVRRVIERLA
ncbi:MAG: aminotransferase class I/II-fold pyridoxal phosphate-dependent enzyme [Armatimonadota bacterium]|nr:MAG: aminotransferase class I/II-fold pyridoxal phosphate-dependent enzyme [Armatimonadota bacterium]